MIARLVRGLPRPLRAAPLALPAGLVPGLAPAAAPARAAAGLSNIQALRGLAALSVLVHHAAFYAQFLRGAERPFPGLDAALGLWGVAVFFAISGFLMAGLVVRDRPLAFLAHRIVRIFPTYLAVVALFAGLFAALGLTFGGLKPLALSLAPAGPRSYPLNVEWTLVFETSFYVGLFVVAVAGLAHRIVPLALGWLGLIAAATLLLPRGAIDLTAPPLYALALSGACIPFAGGLLLPRLIASGRLTPSLGLLALPLGAACLLVETEAARWLGGAAAVLLVGAAAAGRQMQARNPLSRAALALGDWSYVLYLVHVPVLWLAAALLPGSGLAYGLAGIAASLGVAALLGPLDVALYRRLRRRIDATAPRALRRGLSLYLAVFLGCAAWGSVETARNDRQESRARAALAALPPESWASRTLAESALSGRGLALPASLRGELEAIETLSPTDIVVSAFAFDPERPKLETMLAVFCDGRLVGLDRPRRYRKDLAARPGLDGIARRRTGYRMRLPLAACPAGAVPLGVAIDADGRMAVLPGTAGR
ncbi:acyltransferase [Methylorubrum sp. SB2]|uniref:acyltransferase family protein n=1 Tax=Methylorubrum subtropicum TaxID=3138812 RepID=UPI00313D562A